ncbi:DNA repair protein endonuclease SAE2/CtIP C-terminus-domain-containing protein [Mycena amicta]|nr:DNA repair protein endonuclease SAE2/CtIP C-terminus-domain-containing protein [Mycena amicta]
MDGKAFELLDLQLQRSSKDALALANFLGFQTVGAATCYISVVPENKTYKDLLERIDTLDAEILRERQENELLRAQLQAQRIVPPATLLPQSESSTKKELQSLTQRYDDLLATKQKANEKYAKDQRKFHALMLHIKSPEYQQMEHEYRADCPNLSLEERKRRRAALHALTEKKLNEIGLQVPPSFSQLSNDDDNKENQRTPIPAARKQHVSTPNHRSQSSTRTAAALENSSIANSSRPAAMDYGRVLIPNSSDTELSLEPHYDTDPVEVLDRLPSLNIPLTLEADVSKTESDFSQDPFPLIKPESGDLLPVAVPTVSVLSPPEPVTEPKVEPISSLKLSSSGKSRHNDESRVITNGSAEVDEGGERPRKLRRVSSIGPTDRSKRRISTGDPGSSAATPLYVASGDTPPSKRTSVNSKKPVSKGEKRIKSEFQTPVVNAHASSSKQSTDYSVYKGRGRYARNAPDNQTINANFRIDAARNGGMDYEYDDVVRGREQRRPLHAEDCECCHDYYERVGPMPQRLQPPLWRSPPKDSDPTTREEQVAAHKQAISRHRHNWTRGNTPPGYWTIGFPSTQEVNNINEKAREMQQLKRNLVEQEAGRENGRYRKKG